MKHMIAIGLAAMFTSAQADVLYDNGAAVSGAPPLSILRVGGSILGFGAQERVPNRVADDFTVAGSDWDVESLSFFAYQTSATSFPFTSVSWSIVSDDVNTGTVVASGTDNVTSGGLLGYRVISLPQSDTQRGIYELVADVPDFTLSAANYWLRWGITGNAALAGPWQPPTASGVVGNARQSVANAAFALALDENEGVELPFVIRGTVGGQIPEPATLALLGLGLAGLGFSRRKR